jgi:hypothetical protein
MPSLIQPSFAAGELSTSLYARVDLAKYKSGAATLRNLFVDYRGGASSRPGTKFVALSATPGTGPPPRLIRFQFSAALGQSYELEFGLGYLAFYRSGAPILSGAFPYTIASPYALADLPLLKLTQSADVVTLVHPSYPPMQLKRFADANWTLSAVTFVPLTGVPTILSARNALGSSGGAIVRSTVYRYTVSAVDSLTGEEGLPSAPFALGDCACMSAIQGESVRVTWTPVAGASLYRLYRQEEVPNSAATPDSIFGLVASVQGTAFTDVNGVPDFTAGPPAPANPFANGVVNTVVVTAGGAGYSDRVTCAIASATGQGFKAVVSVSGGVISAVTVINGGFGYLPGDTISFTDPGSAVLTGSAIAAGGQNYKDVNWWVTDPTGYGGSINLTGAGAGLTVTAVTAPGQDYTDPKVVITSTTGSGALVNLTIGAASIGGGGTATFTLANPGNYPGCTAYFVQRQWFAGSTAKPETFWASKIAAFNNFTKAQPVQPGDAITATLAATQVNPIRCLIPMPSGLIAGTAGGAFLISGGSVGPGGIPAAISPSSVVAQPQAANGFSDLPPIVIDYDVLFVQSKGSIVRDLSYNFYVNIYTGQDITTLSNHLFANRLIREWAYAEEPYKLVWCVRDDGVLLSLTFNKPQEVQAWTRHDTDGLFQSVCVVSEGNVDATYFVVKRMLQGVWHYVIERLADRALIDANAALGIPANIENAWCVDCGVSLAQPAPAAGLSIDGAVATPGAVCTFTADAGGIFAVGDIGKVIRANGGRATVTARLSDRQVAAIVLTGFPVVPNDPDACPLPAAAGAWTMTAPVTTLAGLDHLNGLTVAILADGNVMPPQVVVMGSITLPIAASSIIAGLPFTWQLQTLNLDVGDGGPGGTIQGKLKKVQAVTVMVKDTRGIKAGRTLDTLVPVKEWSSNVNLGGPLPLVTGMQRVVLDALYEQTGRLWLQGTDPVPSTISGVVPEVTLGG